MSDTSNPNGDENTSGDEGKNTLTHSSTAQTATSAANGGLDAKALAAMIESMLDSKLKTLTPSPEEPKPNTQPNPGKGGEDNKLYSEEEMQARINSAIKSRLREKDEQFQQKLTEAKQQWLEEAQKAFDKQRNKAIEEAIAARDFDQAKKTLQSELGLSDIQMTRLQGKTLDELKADAVLLGFYKENATSDATPPPDANGAVPTNTQHDMGAGLGGSYPGRKTPPTISQGNGRPTILGDASADDIASLVSEGLRM